MDDADRELAAWIEHGDHAALERALLLLLPVGTAVARTVFAGVDADDAVQSAVVRLLRAAPRWRARGCGARAWFAAIVANECRNLLRRERRARRHRVALAATVPVSTSPDDPSLDHEELRHALGELPDHERSAILTRYLAGADTSEAAAALGCSERSIRSWTAAGMARLRRRLGAAALLVFLGESARAAEPTPSLVAGSRELAASAKPVIHRWPLAPSWLGISALALGGLLAGVMTLLALSERTSTAAASLAATPAAPANSTPVQRAGDVTSAGPPLRWVARQLGPVTRRLVILGHAGTDAAQAEALLARFALAADGPGWLVLVAWRSQDRDASDPSPLDAVRLIADLDRQQPLSPNRTIIAGISYGGESALTAALAGLVPIAGAIGWPGLVSGRLVVPVPILLGGCRDDRTLWTQGLQSGIQALQTFSAPLTVDVEPGTEHMPDPVRPALRQWLERTIPAQAAALDTNETLQAARTRLASADPAELARALRDLGLQATNADAAQLAERLNALVASPPPRPSTAHDLAVILSSYLLGYALRHGEEPSTTVDSARQVFLADLDRE